MRTAVTISVSTESGREREVTSRVTRVRDSLDSPSPSDGRVARLPGRRIMEASSGTMVIFETSPRMDPAAVASPNLCTLPVSASVKEAKPIVVVRAVRTHAVPRRLIARRAASEREQSLVRRISIMIWTALAKATTNTIAGSGMLIPSIFNPIHPIRPRVQRTASPGPAATTRVTLRLRNRPSATSMARSAPRELVTKNSFGRLARVSTLTGMLPVKFAVQESCPNHFSRSWSNSS